MKTFSIQSGSNGNCIYVEADDVPMGELTSFPRAVQIEDGEAVVLSWIEYPDRATRDACNARVRVDPRMEKLVTNSFFAGRRMIYGGFSAFLDR